MKENTGGSDFGLIINQTGVTDIREQAEMVKEISAQHWMWYNSNDKNKRETFA